MAKKKTSKRTSKKAGKKSSAKNTAKQNKSNWKSILEKKYKVSSIFTSADQDFVDSSLQKISSGELSLDIALGGGYAIGRTHKLQGRWSSGKSRALASVMMVITRFLKQKVLFIDHEGTSNYHWLEQCGVDIDYVDYSRTITAEMAFDTAELGFSSGDYFAIFIDSIASMSPKEELDKANDEATQAALARAVSRFFRKVDARQNEAFLRGETVPTVFYTNQIRTNLHARFNKDVTPGGTQQDNASTTIMDFYRGADISVGDGSEEEVVGFYTYITLKKLKSGSPGKRTMIGLCTDKGGYNGHPQFSWLHADTLQKLGIKAGIISATGAWYEVAGEKYHGQSNLQKAIMSEFSLRDMLVNAIVDIVSDLGVQFKTDYILTDDDIVVKTKTASEELLDGIA